MEGAAGGWGDMNMQAPAFDCGMAFSAAELDYILFEGSHHASVLGSSCLTCPSLCLLQQSCWNPNSKQACAMHPRAAVAFY
jgi:hypothetical protein